MEYVTRNDVEALINYAQPTVAEPRANVVRVDADFSATPFNSDESRAGAKIANPEQLRKFPASSRRRLRLVIGGRAIEAGAVSVRIQHGGPYGGKQKGRSGGKHSDRGL